MSRLASEQTRHSSAVGSACAAGAGGSAAGGGGAGGAASGGLLLAPAFKELGSLSAVPSLPKPVPSLRHDVKVLQRFGSGHKSRGV